jgi:guanosine-3',5'-bis(diphosphate) 3'-pyrophosphohydrolase
MARRLASALGPRASTLEEFYRQAGLGRIVIDAKLIEAVFGPVPRRKPGLLGKAAARLVPGPGQSVRIQDLEGQGIKLAKCCSPVKGEPVVGYLTAGQGLTQRLIEVSWAPSFAGAFKARLLVKSKDSPGVLAKVAAAVAGLDGDIFKAEASTKSEGKARIRLDIRIRDIRHLEAISRKISGLKEVVSVERD